MNLKQLQVWIEGFSNGLAKDRPPSAEQWKVLLKTVADAKEDPAPEQLNESSNYDFSAPAPGNEDDYFFARGESDASCDAGSPNWVAKPRNNKTSRKKNR